MQTILLEYAGMILIQCFLLITFIISAYEKIHGWQITQHSFRSMFQETFVAKIVIPVLIFLITMETLVVTLSAIAIWDILRIQELDYARYALIGSCILDLIFLFGLRMIKDYTGAARIGIYFLISIVGLYSVQLVF